MADGGPGAGAIEIADKTNHGAARRQLFFWAFTGDVHPIRCRKCWYKLIH